MPKAGELTYYERIGEAGRRHALNKPYSDENCGLNLMRIGVVFALLPAPPARVLECGCGTGWLTQMLHSRGYETVGTDVAEDAIRLAKSTPVASGAVPPPHFLTADSESLRFQTEFDAVLFFDSLHHSLDERSALAGACRALKPGGVCIAVEPGRGHHRRSRKVIDEHDVTEKDMPPAYVGRLGLSVGFSRWDCYPAPHVLGKALYATHQVNSPWLRKLLRFSFARYAVASVAMLFTRSCGITVLYK